MLVMPHSVYARNRSGIARFERITIHGTLRIRTEQIYLNYTQSEILTVLVFRMGIFARGCAVGVCVTIALGIGLFVPQFHQAAFASSQLPTELAFHFRKPGFHSRTCITLRTFCW